MKTEIAWRQIDVRLDGHGQYRLTQNSLATLREAASGKTALHGLYTRSLLRQGLVAPITSSIRRNFLAHPEVRDDTIPWKDRCARWGVSLDCKTMNDTERGAFSRHGGLSCTDFNITPAGSAVVAAMNEYEEKLR